MWMRMHALYKAAEMAMAAAGRAAGGELEMTASFRTVVAVETGGADETS
jgi:hypothetical protein